MTPADHTAVGRVGWEAWQSIGPLDRAMTAPGVAERVRAAFQRFPEVTRGDIILAHVDDRVAGWAARDGARDEISDVWIAPAFQRRGIGRALVEHVCAIIRDEGLRQAHIETHQKNFHALALYRHCGFQIVWQGMAVDRVLQMEIPKARLRRRL